MLRVYIDDSGKPDQSPVQVLAGYMASTERWGEFSNEWQAILDSHGLPYFRMSEAWRFERKFRKIGDLRRDASIVQLIECIKRHVEMAFVSSIPYEGYNYWFAIDATQKHKAFRPYFFGFYTLLSQIYIAAKVRRYTERVEVVFDEQGGEPQDFILSCMDHFRQVASGALPTLVIPTPKFQSDKDALPLQAADLLAWLVRRDALNLVRGKNRSKSVEAILLGEALAMSNDVIVWDEDRFKIASAWLVKYLISAKKTIDGT